MIGPLIDLDELSSEIRNEDRRPKRSVRSTTPPIVRRDRKKELRELKERDRRAMRQAEFHARRGPLLIWFEEEVCGGLSEDQCIAVNEFVSLNTPFINKALIFDRDAMDIRIRRRGEESVSTEPLSKLKREAYTHAHNKVKADMKTAYQRAVVEGEIGKLERFVEELKAGVTKAGDVNVRES